MAEISSSRIVITVLESNRPGIVAAVSGALAEREANILDISQTILQGIFTMTMLVEPGESVDFSELKGASRRPPSFRASTCPSSARTSLTLCTACSEQAAGDTCRAHPPVPKRTPRRHRDQLWNQGHRPHPHLAYPPLITCPTPTHALRGPAAFVRERPPLPRPTPTL